MNAIMFDCFCICEELVKKFQKVGEITYNIRNRILNYVCAWVHLELTTSGNTSFYQRQTISTSAAWT